MKSSQSLPSIELAILSFNKSSSTIALLDSIKKFEPHSDLKISILDQGSHLAELANLKENISDPRINLVELNRNLGVGGGRQKQLQDSTSEWILYLDNDLILHSSILQSCLEITKIANFGCLPFSESTFSGIDRVVIPHLFIEHVNSDSPKKTFGLGTSSDDFTTVRHPFEISGVAGGVFFANVKRLKQLGGFRGPGKVGYEDLDLSLRLNKEKEKIFLVNVEKPLQHFKAIKGESEEVSSELVRLDPYQIRLNAKFVEYEHDGTVWGANQYHWLAERSIAAGLQKEMIKSIIPEVFPLNRGENRPRILLVCDMPGWAFDRIAQQYKTLLTKWFDITITYSSDWEALKIILLGVKWDAVVFLWRVPLFQLIRENLLRDDFLPKIGYCVYDHQGNLGYDREVAQLEEWGVPVGAVNETLLKSLANLHRSTYLIPDGVDTGLFKPSSSKTKNKLIVGWSGNTKWGGTDDVKGFSSVIQPCINRVGIDDIEFDVIDSSLGRIPQSLVAVAMKKWDVVLCTSSHEGTPNPVLEGLASGLVVISTQVGMTKELMNKGAQIRIIQRNPEDLAMKLTEVATLKKLSALKEETSLNREAALSFDWQRVITNHKEFVFNILKRSV